VIGLPGETVEIRDGLVWIDGRRLAESYTAGSTSPDNIWRLGGEEIFVMGDNRGLSLDSRSFGPVSMKEVVGKAWIIYWPPAEWGLIDWRNRAADPAGGTAFRYNSILRFPGCGGRMPRLAEADGGSVA
jgi:signal peptidase I